MRLVCFGLAVAVLVAPPLRADVVNVGDAKSKVERQFGAPSAVFEVDGAETCRYRNGAVVHFGNGRVTSVDLSKTKGLPSPQSAPGGLPAVKTQPLPDPVGPDVVERGTAQIATPDPRTVEAPVREGKIAEGQSRPMLTRCPIACLLGLLAVVALIFGVLPLLGLVPAAIFCGIVAVFEVLFGTGFAVAALIGLSLLGFFMRS